jgi:hypothetical protein
VEFKLGLPMWEDCLMAAIEKFKLGGSSATNIAVLVKNHCANETAQDGKKNITLLVYSLLVHCVLIYWLPSPREIYCLFCWRKLKLHEI